MTANLCIASYMIILYSYVYDVGIPQMHALSFLHILATTSNVTG